MLVKNWSQVYKSLAVWFPVIATGLYTILKESSAAGLVPDSALPIVVGITGALGWVIKQPSLRRKP